MHEQLNSTMSGWPDCMPWKHNPRHPRCVNDTALRSECVRCPQRPRTRWSQRRVACVGDSITAGVDATGREHTYPSVLQRLLGEEFVVTNLGSSGATMQVRGARPFVDTAMYRALLSARWDVVIIMLGTNDARSLVSCDEAAFWNMPCATLKRLPALWQRLDSWGAASWHEGDGPESSASALAADTAALLAMAQSLGDTAERPPRVFLATPPPLVRDGTSGVDRTLLNHVIPQSLRRVAQATPGTSLIDMHAPFGGAALRCEGGANDSALCGLWFGCPSDATPAAGLERLPGVARASARHGGRWCDWLHPSDAGYRVLARTVYGAMAQAGLV